MTNAERSEKLQTFVNTLSLRASQQSGQFVSVEMRPCMVGSDGGYDVIFRCGTTMRPLQTFWVSEQCTEWAPIVRG
ncbi:hypothetical protein EniLVp02_0051 [Vibrio phage EniLVp02]